MSAPEMLWALHPGDQHCHAVAPGDLDRSETLGYAETLCGAHLPDAGLESADRPWGVLCLPCVIGATADLPDPGRMGTAR
ncbi:MAG: hypothetical protein ACRDRR_25410 [Pseudonocardiaceae bacterium]